MSDKVAIRKISVVVLLSVAAVVSLMVIVSIVL
jgi:hypothetical protein